MKKKVTLLAGLLAFVTVGGVYATWTYAGNDTADVSSLVSVQLSGVEFKGSAGTYTIRIAYGVVRCFDQLDCKIDYPTDS